MERAIIDMPCGLFGPMVNDPILNVRGRSAGEGVTGTGQVAYGNQPRWEISWDISGFGRNRVLAWRAIRARMRGRVNILRICMCDRWRPTYRELGLSYGEGATALPHSDGTFFSDGTGYAYEPTMVSLGYEAGDETITIDATSINDALQPGQWFSHDDWPYQVTGIDGTITARVYSFEPPLRRDIPAGDEITLEATALMAFIDDTQGRMPLILGKHGDAQIQLVEWTNRP